MSLYLVSYELAHTNEFCSYDYFHAELRKYRARRVLPHVILVRSSLDANTIRDALLKFVHQDDRILVAEISETNWAAWKALAETSDL
jgi:hypothetical protein